MAVVRSHDGFLQTIFVAPALQPLKNRDYAQNPSRQRHATALGGEQTAQTCENACLRQLSPNRPDPLALPQRLNASLCQEQATAGSGVRRLRPLSFISTASAAESFRSRCGSVRGAPELSSKLLRSLLHR